MADPLSIAASIIGIAAAAGKIGGLLSGFVSSTANAPSSAAAALASVEQMRMTLSSIQPLMESLHALPSSRRGLIQLDHLSVIITHSVLTISELESIVCFEDGLMHRLRWAWNEKRVLGLLPRLDSQKSSLALMVSILQTESDLDARRCQDKLLSKVDEILQQNEALVERLKSLEGRFDPGVPSIKFMDDSTSTMSYRRLSLQSIRSAASSTIGSARRQSAIAISRFSVESRKNFELALAKSRVYTRTTSHDSDMSFTSSTAPTDAWSMLSGLSLNDISVVSAFRLPLNLEDIDCLAPGSTFANLLTEQLAAHEVQPGSVSNESTKEMWENSTTSEQSTGRGLPEPNIGPSSYHRRFLKKPSAARPMKIVLVGNKEALKSEMLHAYINPNHGSGVKYIPQGQNSFNVVSSFNNERFELSLHDTTGQENYPELRLLNYSNTDVFLILSNQEYDQDSRSVKEIWLPEISARCSRTPCIVVKTGHQKPSATLPTSKPNERAEPPSISLKDGSRTFRQLSCDVTDPRNVRIIFGQAILVALLDQSNRTNLKQFLNSWERRRTITSVSQAAR